MYAADCLRIGSSEIFFLPSVWEYDSAYFFNTSTGSGSIDSGIKNIWGKNYVGINHVERFILA